MRRVAALVLVAALAGAGAALLVVVRERAPGSAVGDGATPAPTAATAATAATVPAEPVRLAVGDDFQEVVDRYPPGTSYVIAAGVHRLQEVVVDDGDTFVGEDGAVLSGARVLEGFTPRRGLWAIDGQSQQGFVHGTVLEGREAVRHPEDLWLDDVRLEHVAELEDVGPGRWYFAYDDDRIWMGDDPRGRRVETSVASAAFRGPGTRDVTIRNVVVERYANRAQRGAIDGYASLGWRVVDVTARENHAGGIGIGPGMQVEGCAVLDNGQIGIVGTGTVGDGADAISAPVSVRRCEIARNGSIGFDWQWEAGATKFKRVRGLVFEQNWVHDNDGPGPWFDVDNFDVVVRSNLVEGNTAAGILYEISFGEAVIAWNEVRGNGVPGPRSLGVGISISTSSGVDVRANLVDDQLIGIYAQGDDRGISDVGGPRVLRDLVVEGNVVVGAERNGIDVGDALDVSAFRSNTYVTAGNEPTFVLGDERLTFTEWQDVGMDEDGAVVAGPAPGLPDGAEPFRRAARYGAR